MKKKLIIIAILYFALAVSAWWIFDDDEETAIPRIEIGKDEYLFNLSGFVCSDILACSIWSNDSFYHDYINGFNWIYHANATDRTRWDGANATENVTFDYVSATGFIGDGSQLTNVGLTEETAVTLSTKAGENIDKGECVYISGAVGQVAQVNLCDNTDSEKDHPIGLSAESKTTGQTMLVRVTGLITTLDTSSWSENDTLYANNDGSITNSYPLSGVVIEIAHVVYSHAVNGRLLVHMHTPRDYQSAPSGGDIDLRLGDSTGATCVEFENYTDGDIAFVCSDGSAWFANDVNTTDFYQAGEQMFDYSDIIGIGNTTAKWGYAGGIPITNTTAKWGYSGGIPDSNVSDTITIGASGTVDTGAISPLTQELNASSNNITNLHRLEISEIVNMVNPYFDVKAGGNIVFFGTDNDANDIHWFYHDGTNLVLWLSSGRAFQLASGSKLLVNTIDESGTGSGVTIETVLLKDGNISGTYFIQDDNLIWDYSDTIPISNTTAKWGYAGGIPLATNVTGILPDANLETQIDRTGFSASESMQTPMINSSDDIDIIVESETFTFAKSTTNRPEFGYEDSSGAEILYIRQLLITDDNRTFVRVTSPTIDNTYLDFVVDEDDSTTWIGSSDALQFRVNADADDTLLFVTPNNLPHIISNHAPALNSTMIWGGTGSGGFYFLAGLPIGEASPTTYTRTANTLLRGYGIGGVTDYWQLTHNGDDTIFSSASGNIYILPKNNLYYQTGGVSATSYFDTYSTTDSHRTVLNFRKIASDTIGGTGAVVDNEALGTIDFRGMRVTNNDIVSSSQIRAVVEGSPSSARIPSELNFLTGTDSAEPTVRMIIASDGTTYFSRDRTVGNSYDIYTNDVFTDDGGVSAWDVEDNELYDIQLLKGITTKQKNNKTSWDLSNIIKTNSTGHVVQSVYSYQLAPETKLMNVTIEFNETHNTTEIQMIETGKLINSTWVNNAELNGYLIGVIKTQQLQIEDLQNESLVLHNMLEFFYDEINLRITNIYDELNERLSIFEAKP